MPQTQIRGLTQIMEGTVPLQVLSEDLRALLLKVQERIEVVAFQGQDVVADARIDPDETLYVFRNGVLLRSDEFIALPGEVLFANPVLDAQENITILVGDAPPLAGFFDPYNVPPLPSALRSTDKAVVVRADGLHLLPVSYLGFTSTTLEPGLLEPGIVE
jgi:hypothetical protein